MVNMLMYLVASYLIGLFVVLVVSRYLRGRWSGSPRRRCVVLACLAVIVVAVPLAPYAVVEGRTRMYARSLSPAVHQAMRQIGFEDAIRSLKVLSISHSKAVVYVVTPCMHSKSDYRACTVELMNARSRWRFREGSDRIVWSDCGSADGNIFPPYPSAGDYR